MHFSLPTLCCCCVIYLSTLCILTICQYLHFVFSSRPPSTSEQSTVSSAERVDAGLTAAAAIHVGRTPGVDAASKAAASDGDSIAADGTDDTMLSEAVAQFYTGKKQDSSGAMKVFTRYSTLLLTPRRPVHASPL